MNNYNKLNIKSVIFAVILCMTSILGMNSILHTSIMGIALTSYRVCIPCLFIVFVYLIIIKKDRIGIAFSDYQKNIIKLAIIVFSVWIIYSIIQIVLFDGLEFKEGAKALLSLILAAMTVFIMCSASFFQVKTYDYIRIIKIIYVLVICLAVIEVLFGVHLDTSKLSNIDRSLYTEENIQILKHMATSIFFNPNDLAAFVAIILPLFFISNTKVDYSCNVIVLLLSIAVLRINDAWIALFSIIVAYAVYLLLYRDTKEILLSKIGILLSMGISYMWGANLLRKISNIIPEFIIKTGFGDRYLHGGDKIELPTQLKGVEDVLEFQIDTSNSSGATRLDTYITSLKNMFTETFGTGYGPGNFARYLESTDYRETLLSNPHGLWIEILVEFGVVIFALYVAFLVFIYVSLIRLYIKGKSKVVLSAIVVDTAYVFATFSPSSFLSYTYQWLVIGISLIIVIQKDKYINNIKSPEA